MDTDLELEANETEDVKGGATLRPPTTTTPYPTSGGTTK